MQRTSARHETPRHRRRRLLIYGLGFILLTNALTVVFIFMMRSPGFRLISVLRGATTAAEPMVAESAEQPRPAPRKVHVTSRPDAAMVWHQGRAHGTTPVTIELPAGEAGELRLEKEGYQPRSITVSPGETKVRVRLQHEPVQRAARASQPGTALTSTAAPAVPAAAPAASAATATVPHGAAPASAAQPPETRADAPAAAAPAARHHARQKPASPAPASENPDPWADERRPAGATENPDPWAE
jgi:hypothetical protein